MNRAQLEQYFSAERLAPYFNRYPGNDPKAQYLYEANILVSEALYTPLSILEVALRNKISNELTRKYNRPDWYAEWYKHPVMHHAWHDVNATINRLHKDKMPVVPERIVASLMFGFWTALFNDRYDRELWGNLRFVFSNMPKNIRQSRNISTPLNDIRRTLRNRVYHNEPIIFNTATVNNHYNNILNLLTWMGVDLRAYNDARDRFPAILIQVNNRLKQL